MFELTHLPLILSYFEITPFEILRMIGIMIVAIFLSYPACADCSTREFFENSNIKPTLKSSAGCIDELNEIDKIIDEVDKQ